MTLENDAPSMRCEECGWTSFHPQDVLEQRCSCHKLLRDTPEEEEAA